MICHPDMYSLDNSGLVPFSDSETKGIPRRQQQTDILTTKVQRLTHSSQVVSRAGDYVTLATVRAGGQWRLCQWRNRTRMQPGRGRGAQEGGGGRGPAAGVVVATAVQRPGPGPVVLGGASPARYG